MPPGCQMGEVGPDSEEIGGIMQGKSQQGDFFMLRKRSNGKVRIKVEWNGQTEGMGPEVAGESGLNDIS